MHCFDPDAPTGSGFWHWVVVNIPASVTELKLDAGNPNAGLLPKGALQTRTDFGKPGYGGPCPPRGRGPHHYHFKLFALDTDKLGLGPGAKVADVENAAGKHALAQGELIGTFERK